MQACAYAERNAQYLLLKAPPASGKSRALMFHTPREWFIVPLHTIETAVKLLINGEIINYRYDNNNQEIIEK